VLELKPRVRKDSGALTFVTKSPNLVREDSGIGCSSMDQVISGRGFARAEHSSDTSWRWPNTWLLNVSLNLGGSSRTRI